MYLIIEYVRLCTSILLLVMYLSIGNTSDEQIFFINKYHSIILFNSYYNNTAISDQPTKYIIVSRSAVSCSLHYILINQVLLSWYHSLIVIDIRSWPSSTFDITRQTTYRCEPGLTLSCGHLECGLRYNIIYSVIFAKRGLRIFIKTFSNDGSVDCGRCQ